MDEGITSLKRRIQMLRTRKEKLEQKVAFRPQPSQYPGLCRYVESFVSNIFSGNKLLQSVDKVHSMMRDTYMSESGDGCGDESNQGMLINITSNFKNVSNSCLKVSQQLAQNYPLYADITTNISSGLQQCSFALDLLSTSINNLQHSKHSHNITQTLSTLTQFPLNSSHTHPSYLLTAPANQPTPYHRRQLKCQLLLLRNHQLLGGTLTYHNISRIMDIYVGMWKRDEEEMRKREIEKESYFKFKATTTTSSLSEEDQDALEIQQNFQQFTQVLRVLQNVFKLTFCSFFHIVNNIINRL